MSKYEKINIENETLKHYIEELKKLTVDLLPYKEKNLELLQLLGQSTQENKSSTAMVNAFEKTIKFGVSDVVDSALGIKIDPKILIPIQPSDLSQNLLDQLNLISISDMKKENSDTHIVGSYRWRAHQYPGDIDMMEIYKVTANSEQEAALKIKQELQKMADNINKVANVRMADFKCGVDTRFNLLVKHLGILNKNYV